MLLMQSNIYIVDHEPNLASFQILLAIAHRVVHLLVTYLTCYTIYQSKAAVYRRWHIYDINMPLAPQVVKYI